MKFIDFVASVGVYVVDESWDAVSVVVDKSVDESDTTRAIVNVLVKLLLPILLGE